MTKRLHKIHINKTKDLLYEGPFSFIKITFSALMFVLYLFCEGQTVLENIFLQGEVQGEKKTLKFRTRIKRVMLAKQFRVINQGKVM